MLGGQNLGVARSLLPVQQPSETLKQLVLPPYLPSLHFTLLDEDNATNNTVVSEKTSSPLSDSAVYRRQQFSPSEFRRPHSAGPDHRRHSAHSKLSLPTPSGLLVPGSAARSRRQSESRRRSSHSELPPDPNMEASTVTYPLSLTRSRNSIVRGNTGSPFGYGDYIPQEQPGQVYLGGCCWDCQTLITISR